MAHREQYQVGMIGTVTRHKYRHQAQSKPIRMKNGNEQAKRGWKFPTTQDRTPSGISCPSLRFDLRRDEYLEPNSTGLPGPLLASELRSRRFHQQESLNPRGRSHCHCYGDLSNSGVSSDSDSPPSHQHQSLRTRQLESLARDPSIQDSNVDDLKSPNKGIMLAVHLSLCKRSICHRSAVGSTLLIPPVRLDFRRTSTLKRPIYRTQVIPLAAFCDFVNGGFGLMFARDPDEKCIAVIQPGGDKGVDEFCCIGKGKVRVQSHTEIEAEFARLTSVDLKGSFFAGLDQYLARFLELYKAKSAIVDLTRLMRCLNDDATDDEDMFTEGMKVGVVMVKTSLTQNRNYEIKKSQTCAFELMKNCEQKSQIEVEILRLKKVDLMRENLQIMRFESRGFANSVNVEFEEMTEFTRRPIGQACGNILHIADTYENFPYFRSEFNAVLESNV
ncbi:hypothetical protein F2P81_014494 [Scophthalmus maximus]|uniref:Uncharacterized protein n=1 Tax=Scophthalmus maximus TaxID=52904 RepID=A0A6A4SMA7_SCOMX|nr:hypothetical protein F2P81_014494 [Scophthalmus maximus]